MSQINEKNEEPRVVCRGWHMNPPVATVRHGNDRLRKEYIFIYNKHISLTVKDAFNIAISLN